MKNIVLIGMPGAGKSTIGVLLAKTLGFSFIDTDLVIQQDTGRLLQEIIDTDGLDAFCEAEEQALLSVADARNAVIATGGSAVYCLRAMPALRQHGTIFYLALPTAELEQRLKNIKTRGIAMRPGSTIEDVFNERSALYEKYSDITIDCQGKNAEDIVAEISSRLTAAV